MKAGVAVQTVVTRRLAETVDQFAGNVVLVLTPDEEGDSRGILAALPHLRQLAAQEGLHYLGVINTDYTAPRFPGDNSFYVYWGAVGKLLPTFYVVGRETHVGEAFDGFDANLLSSELMRRINMNADLCDEDSGEVALPPVSLKQQDLKFEYSVQTPFAAVLYFNMATHAASPGEILDRFRARAAQAFDNVIAYLNAQYRRYCDRIEHDFRPLPWKSQVLTYEELYRKVRGVQGGTLDRSLDALAQRLGAQEAAMDERKLSLAIVEEVWRQSGLRGPAIVLFFSPPYYPHIGVPEGGTMAEVEAALKDDAARGEPARDAPARFYAAAERMLRETVQREQLRIEKRHFYPYISDMSFFGLSARIPGTREFIANTPAWGRGYHLAVEGNEDLLLPVVNLGPYGKDAHKMSERVLVDYSFRVVPEMVYGMLMEIFRGDR
ncbi:MAG: M20/M25/M40 family metallo-hydrolase [Firmicutes bacterium]|nr:M20/M25/M40 family metallo-hydrolase [Bacillota bacterium]